MDGVKLQSKLWKGYGKAALRIGTPYAVYRPSGATNPIVSGNLITTIPAAFTIHGAGQYKFDKPSDYKDALFHGLFDATMLHQGDYLVGSSGTYFISAFDPIKPILCVNASRTLTISRQNTIAAPGSSNVATLVTAYSGDTIANETAIYQSWPGVLAYVDKSMWPAVQLPADTTKPGGWKILLPAIPGFPAIMENDIVTDDSGKRYQVDAAWMDDIWILHARFLKA